MRDDDDNIYEENDGLFKTWTGTLLFVGGFIGYLAALMILSQIPSLQWLMITLVGLLFFATGLFFLKMSKGSFFAPMIGILVGVVIMYLALSGKFFPNLSDAIGNKGIGTILTTIGLIFLVYPFAITEYYKARYKTSVVATVSRVDHHFSRADRHHAHTFRSVYEFTYSGREYEVMDKVYVSGRHPMTGDTRELLIDEDNPEHFFDIDRMKGRSITSYIVPVIIVGLGIYLIVA
jgi:hypothetical protein